MEIYEDEAPTEGLPEEVYEDDIPSDEGDAPSDEADTPTEVLPEEVYEDDIPSDAGDTPTEGPPEVIYEGDAPAEVLPEVTLGTCVCENPFCPDVGLERPLPVGLASYWCGTCGVRMAPPPSPLP